MTGRLLLGHFHGLRSSAPTDWETVYADIGLDEGARFSIPPEHEERALYLLEGEVEVAGVAFNSRQMLILKEGKPVDLKALSPARVLLLGGATMDGPRYVWWNFVSSSRERIEEARRAWELGEFPSVPSSFLCPDLEKKGASWASRRGEKAARASLPGAIATVLPPTPVLPTACRLDTRIIERPGTNTPRGYGPCAWQAQQDSQDEGVL